MPTLLGLLPTILQISQGVLPLLKRGDTESPSWLDENLPLILSTVGAGAELLAQWHALASQAGGPTDAQLAALAAGTEAALAESQAALR